MTQFTIELMANGQKTEVITADDGQDAYEEACRILDEELPDWMEGIVHDVRDKQTERLPESDD